MKKLIVTLLSAVLLIGMTACHASKPKHEAPGFQAQQVDPKDQYSDYQGVSVQVDDLYLEDGRLNLVVVWSNQTQYDAVFGADYVIERYENGAWVDCAKADELSFIAIAYELKAGNNRNETYDLTNMYDVSRAGAYRFKTSCSVHTGSDDADNVTLWAEFTLSQDTAESQTKPQEAVDFGVQYIRTNGRDGVVFPNVKIIRSVEELNSYYEANKDTFDLERKDEVYSDTTIGFLDACDKYDAEYFKKGYLVFVLLEEGSGSIRHEVTGSTISSDGELGIYIKTIIPEVGTCDMAEWHIIVEMSNAVEVKGENSIQVYLDGRLAFDRGAAVTQVIGTQSPVIFREPPDVKLHRNGSTPLMTAGYRWMYPNGDGTMGAVIAECAHPLDCKSLLDPIYVTGDYVKLEFEDDPDSIEVHCWPDTAWNSDAEPEAVSCYETTAFDIKQGGYIYEISAKWEESETQHHGCVSYYAYLVTDEEHYHQAASQPQTVDSPVHGYCGNIQTTLYIDGEAYSFMYDESVTLTDLLINLDYDPNKLCKCRPEYTVDTELGKGYGINLTAGYARCEKGQADLTQGQIDQIRAIIEWATDAANNASGNMPEPK